MKEYFKRTKMLDEAKMQSRARRPIIEVLIFFLVYTIGTAAQSIFIYPAVFIHLFGNINIDNYINDTMIDQEKLYESFLETMSDLPDWVMLVTLFSTYAIIITVIIYCRCIEKRSVSSMGFRKKNAVLEYFVGMIFGAVLFSAVVGIGYVIGAFKFSGFSDASVIMIFLYFLGYIIQGMSEEVLIHGYYMTSVSRSTGPTYALITSSVMFALLNFGSSGFNFIALINVFLFGLIMGIYVLKRGNIWGACAIHSMWNFTQSNVFGLSGSGISNSSAVLSFKAKEGITNITGGSFGPEGGLLVTLVLFLVLGIVFSLKTNKSEISDMVFENEEEEIEQDDENI